MNIIIVHNYKANTRTPVSWGVNNCVAGIILVQIASV